ncbi:GGDEF domain-containing protein [Breoghania sp.]|uniref:GGDEF domain-containing protein n=1 Tax=Breoghania sp. TaxID=2065378 RepID=UPI0026192052|nr:GGDEF domain-containing protein [Breoghania sp.]MDJ0932982.1 GGDEF domain-containing protein [Breoghania sp.]
MVDFTERRKVEARVAHMAHHDALTDLPNRVLFREGLQDALTRTQRNQGLVAVLCLNLDHFKEVNDTLGHPVGDKLLQAVAKRSKTIPAQDRFRRTSVRRRVRHHPDGHGKPGRGERARRPPDPTISASLTR